MNYYYITINILFIIWATYEWRKPLRLQNDTKIVISFVVAGSMLLLATMSIWYSKTIITTAESIKMGNEIIVQSAENPTLIVTDIKFDGVPLQVSKHVRVNVYGYWPEYTYTVEIIKP